MKRAMHSRARLLVVVRWLLLATATALGCAVGCSDGTAPHENTPTSPSANGKGEGSLAFALTTPGNIRFDKFDYVIVGPHFARAKSIDVSNSTSISAIIDTIPVGSGYTLTLSAASLPPDEVVCSGSAPFAITAGEVSSVPVAVQCHERASAPVPIPPFAPIALGLFLLAVGVAPRRRPQRT